MTQITKASQVLSEMRSIFEQVQAKTDELGLKLSVWGASGNCVLPNDTSNEFCNLVSNSVDQCKRGASALAKDIIATGQPSKSRTSLGCCLIGVPVFRRRTLLGAAVACFSVKESLDSENLARSCDVLELDKTIVEQFAYDNCQMMSIEVADKFLRVLDWLVNQEQEIHGARDELVGLSSNLSSTYEELSLMYRISGWMEVTQEPREFLQETADELAEVTHSSVAVVISSGTADVEEDMVVLAGNPSCDEAAILDLAETIVGPQLAGAEGPVVYNNFADTRDGNGSKTIRNLLAVPVSSGNTTTGMLIGFNKDHDFDTIDLKLIDSIGNQTGVFLANHRLYADLQDLLMGVLHALTASIDAKDPYTCGHSQRVALISRRIAEILGYSPQRVERIYLTGVLHDIGKLGVPESVLCKPGKLTDEEFQAIKNHPRIGAGILGGIRQLDDIIPGIITHHERPDGKGYPQGLKDDQVPMSGMIICLADCFDAMTSDRVYRKALPLETAIAEIRKNAGTQFHPVLAEKFLEMDLQAFMEELRSPEQMVFPISMPEEGSK